MGDDKPESALQPRNNPCASCPYRVNVPSGIWSEDEYRKLTAYDGDIPQQLADAEQSTKTFLCHQNGAEVCSGWLAHREPEDLLAVRLGISSGHLAPSCLTHTTGTALFDSGREAAEHGMRNLHQPDDRARAAIEKIVSARARTDRPLE